MGHHPQNFKSSETRTSTSPHRKPRNSLLVASNQIRFASALRKRNRREYKIASIQHQARGKTTFGLRMSLISARTLQDGVAPPPIDFLGFWDKRGLFGGSSDWYRKVKSKRVGQRLYGRRQGIAFSPSTLAVALPSGPDHRAHFAQNSVKISWPFGPGTACSDLLRRTFRGHLRWTVRGPFYSH